MDSKRKAFSIVFLTKLFGILEKINIISTTWMVVKFIMRITLGIGIIYGAIGLNT